MDSDAQRISERRKTSSYYADEEDIVVKPSTELIPDEYQHFSHDMPSVHIFNHEIYYGDVYLELIASLRKIGCQFDEKTSVHGFEEVKDFNKHLFSIKNGLSNANALILIFLGIYKEDGTFLLWDEKGSAQNMSVKEIWNFFTSNNCPELKHKAKIFIFCAGKHFSSVQSDSSKHYTAAFDKVYDFPAESDMLIVYKKNTEIYPNVMKDFLIQLCNNIENYSKKYDIIDLINYTESYKSVTPIFISTLTRKFYLTASNHREHHLSLLENHARLEETIGKLCDGVQALHEYQKKKREKKFTFSFRRKHEDKPKIIKRIDAPSVSHSSTPEPLNSPIPEKREVTVEKDTKEVQSPRRPSVTVPPRSRTTSASSNFDRKQPDRNSSNKPRWKF